MVPIEMKIEVDERRKAIIQFPAWLPPGAYRAVVVVEEPAPVVEGPPLIFSAHDVGPWPEGFTARREDIYGDDGR